MATELGLYKQQPLPAATETIEREALNRTRTWIICFCLDVSISVHFGRPITIARDDAVVKVRALVSTVGICSDHCSFRA